MFKQVPPGHPHISQPGWGGQGCFSSLAASGDGNQNIPHYRLLKNREEVNQNTSFVCRADFDLNRWREIKPTK